MFDYFRKKFELLLEALLDPLWARLQSWVTGLGWTGKILVSALMLLLSLSFVYRDALLPVLEVTGKIYRVTRNNSSHIPLRASLVSRLRETERRMAGSLQADIDQPGNIDVSPWPIAQATVAVYGLATIDRDKITAFFQKTLEPHCGCWKEIPGEGYPRNIPASGWIVFALSQLKVPATRDEIKFFLDQQQPEGWWSTFLVADESQFASTYGTAWALLALQSQLERKLIDAALVKEVAAAIKLGSTWLAAHREVDKSRWKAYPLLLKGPTSDSISGLVIHALHVTAPQEYTQLESDWLNHLPTAVPSAADAENDYYWIKSKDGFHNDNFVQIKLPWLLIATADAYSSGTILQQAYALRWLERALNQESVINADTQTDNWWRAELLFAIRYVLNREEAKSV